MLPASPQHTFERIEHQSMEDDILRGVRLAIISGSIGLGQHLNETDMARQMSVSRIPVREALKKLEQEGLVVRFTNRGVFVVDFSEQDVFEVFSLRDRLESMAIELAAPNLTESDIAALRQLIDQQQQAISDGDYDALARLDVHFHESICLRANHGRLLKSWREIHRQCQVLLNMRFHYLAGFTPDIVKVDHEQILQAVEAGDTATAVQLTHTISQRVQRECVETLRNYRARAT